MKIKELPFSLLLLTLFAIPLSGIAQTFDKERLVSRSFKTTASTEIEVTNKYGDIHLIPWDQDSVRFDIRLQVKSTKQSKLDKTFDFIDFDFKANNYYIIAQTVFEQGGSFWSEVSDIANNLFSAGTSTSIDYTIHLPKNARVSLQNKYGDIYLTDFSGSMSIDLSNGNLKAHDLTGPLNLVVNFGDVDIQTLNEAEITLNYGEFHLDEGHQLKLNNRSASVYANKIDHLSLDGKRSKYYLDELENLDGESYFSNMDIDLLTQSMSLNVRYGALDLKSVGSKVTTLDLTSNDADLTLMLEPEKSYNIQLLVTDKTEVLYSSKITNIKTDEARTADDKIKATCTIGPKKQPVVPVNITSEAGRLSLKMK